MAVLVREFSGFDTDKVKMTFFALSFRLNIGPVNAHNFRKLSYPSCPNVVHSSSRRCLSLHLGS